MSAVRGRLAELGWRRLVFSAVVLFFLGFLAFMMRQLLFYPVAGWFENALGLFGGHQIAPHRIHDFAFSLIFWVAVIGMLAQLRRPERNVAGQLMALIPWIALVIAFALTNFWDPVPMVAIFGGITLLATILHPSGRELLAAVSPSGTNQALLVLAIVAAVPLLGFAATEAGLQTGAIQPAHSHEHAGADAEEIHQDHRNAGHYTLVVAFSFIIIGAALLASLQPAGWWLPAWMAGLLTIVLGVTSLLFHDAASNVGLLWGVGALVWGVAFIATAEYTRGQRAPSPYGTSRPGETMEG